MQTTFNRTQIQVAEDIVEIIYTVLTDPRLGRDLMGAWWFTLYYSKMRDSSWPLIPGFLTLNSIQRSPCYIWESSSAHGWGWHRFL